MIKNMVLISGITLLLIACHQSHSVSLFDENQTSDAVTPLPDFIYENNITKAPIFFSRQDLSNLYMIGYIRLSQRSYALVEGEGGDIVQLQVGQYLSRQQMKIIKITEKKLLLQDSVKEIVILDHLVKKWDDSIIILPVNQK